ncbi:hypothetical protein MHU86_14339 [Fragilaria crotonensis]|nr:hypothetical protein MHU86_14339 [Fragilaria crotonensis]
MNPSGFTTLQKTCKDLHDCLFAHLFNLPFHPSPSRYQPPPARKQCQGESKEPPTLIHPSHPGLESEIATFTHRIASFGYAPTLTEFTGFLQHHEDLEDLVIIAIKMTGDEQLMPILDLLILVRSVIGQRNSHSVPPAHRMVDILAKFERIPTDGSREMTVQNFPSPPRVLVDVDNSAASRTQTMTCHDRSAELGTRNFCAETPDSVQTPFASAPQSPDNRRIYSPPLRLPMTRLILTLFVHFAPRGPLTAEEKALESYCDDDDTVEFTVVDGTAIQSSPPQCAYRAHNPTDPSLSSTSLSVQHPVPIKLEDLPLFPDPDCADVGENYYSPSDNSPTKPSVNFYPASDPVPDPEVLPEVEIMPEPMIIESIEEEFVEETATNPILEALNELPKAATQQPVRMLPPTFS